METIEFKTFMRGKYTNDTYYVVIDKADVGRHLRKHGTKYTVAGLTLIFIGVPGDAFASTGIDKGAMKIYLKLINIGKWVIIVKGGIDIITSITNGDVDSAKKRFFGYLMAYGALFALPWGMGEVEKLFDGEDVFNGE